MSDPAVPERRSALGIFLLVFTPLMLAGAAVAVYIAGTKNAPRRAPAPVSRPADPAPARATIIRGDATLYEGQSFEFVPGAISGGSVRFNGYDFVGHAIRPLGAVELESVRKVPVSSSMWDLLNLFGVRRYQGWAHVRQGHSYAFWFWRPRMVYAVVQVIAAERDPYSGIRSVAFRYKLQTNGTNRF